MMTLYDLVMNYNLKHKTPYKDITKIQGYAHYRFDGEFTEHFLHYLADNKAGLTPADVIQIVDGFNHNFGGVCNISGAKFNGIVEVD